MFSARNVFAVGIPCPRSAQIFNLLASTLYLATACSGGGPDQTVMVTVNPFQTRSDTFFLAILSHGRCFHFSFSTTWKNEPIRLVWRFYDHYDVNK